MLLNVGAISQKVWWSTVSWGGVNIFCPFFAYFVYQVTNLKVKSKKVVRDSGAGMEWWSQFGYLQNKALNNQYPT